MLLCQLTTSDEGQGIQENGLQRNQEAVKKVSSNPVPGTIINKAMFLKSPMIKQVPFVAVPLRTED